MPAPSAFDEHKDELEHYEQMFGRHRGRLAVSLDRLTNALVLVGQHGVYCTSQRNPAVPAMDLRMINQELTHAKELLQSVMEDLRRAKEEIPRAIAQIAKRLLAYTAREMFERLLPFIIFLEMDSTAALRR